MESFSEDSAIFLFFANRNQEVFEASNFNLSRPESVCTFSEHSHLLLLLKKTQFRGYFQEFELTLA